MWVKNNNKKRLKLYSVSHRAEGLEGQGVIGLARSVFQASRGDAGFRAQGRASQNPLHTKCCLS